MNKSITHMMIALAIVGLNLNPNPATAQVDPAARVKATAADVKADQAKADAAAAHAQAIAVGNTAAAGVAAAEGRLNTAVARARGAAFAGDRALERKFRSEADAIKTEIEELKKKAKHECAAFGDKDVQLACLVTFEKNHDADAKVTIHNKDKDVEQSKDMLAQRNHEVEAIVGQTNNLVDKAQGTALGCTPKSTTTTDGVVSTENNCAAGARSVVVHAKSVTKFGVTVFDITPASVATATSAGNSVDDNGQSLTSAGTKAGVVIGSTLVGALIGGGLGYGVQPNHEMVGGQDVNHQWVGPIGGSSLGAATGLVSSLIWAVLTK